MSVTAREHAFYVFDEVHAVQSDIVQATRKWRDIGGCEGTLCGAINGCCLLLGKAKSQIHP